MLINKSGAEFLYNGITYRVGDVIIGSDQSEYAGLIGSILEIRDGDDKETENDTPDIYCSFEPPALPADIAKVEAVFSDLYDTQKTLDDICFDMRILPLRLKNGKKSASYRKKNISGILRMYAFRI